MIKTSGNSWTKIWLESPVNNHLKMRTFHKKPWQRTPPHFLILLRQTSYVGPYGAHKVETEEEQEQTEVEFPLVLIKLPSWTKYLFHVLMNGSWTGSNFSLSFVFFWTCSNLIIWSCQISKRNLTKLERLKSGASNAAQPAGCVCRELSQCLRWRWLLLVSWMLSHSVKQHCPVQVWLLPICTLVCLVRRWGCY
jgi:hypothetical protein